MQSKTKLNSIMHIRIFDILYAQYTCWWYYKERIYKHVSIARIMYILFYEQAVYGRSTEEQMACV